MFNVYEEIKNEIGFEFPKDTKFVPCSSGALKIRRTDGKITVFYSQKRHIPRAALLIKAQKGVTEYEINESEDFRDVTLMADCSRNAVLSVKQAKRTILMAAMLGYSSFMLYTEDTYEVSGEPVFGYLRGRYTKAEIKEIDEYAQNIGIELIPCIQTLAHLSGLKRWYKDLRGLFDIDDILLCGGERTKKLIENIFATLEECFSSRRVHIGMDEAPRIGRGAYLDKNGYKEPFDIFSEHLQFVAGTAKQHGFSVIMWSDMFFKLADRKGYKDENGDRTIPPEIIEKIPENVSVCHWDYRDTADESYTENFKIHRSYTNIPVWYAGSSVKYSSFFPANSYSLRAIRLGLSTAKTYGIKSVINTLWGDIGAECSNMSALPSVAFFASYALGMDIEQTKKIFSALTGEEFDKFMTLEYPNTLMGKETIDVSSPTSYFLYNDLFSGQFDCYATPEYTKTFKQCEKLFKGFRKGKYGYIFDTAYRLSGVLAIKCELGKRLRLAYQSKNYDALKKIVGEIDELIFKLGKFLQTVRKQWNTENKPNGLEVQEYRIGGLTERLKGCKRVINQYILSEIEEIPELEITLLNDVLDSCSPYRMSYNSFILTATNNNL